MTGKSQFHVHRIERFANKDKSKFVAVPQFEQNMTSKIDGLLVTYRRRRARMSGRFEGYGLESLKIVYLERFLSALLKLHGSK